MLYSGLVSITFRELSPREIVDLVGNAGLDGIEWGGDVHVPHGNLKKAREVRRMTEQANLKIASYGSYYYVGHDDPVSFQVVLNTAVELGAGTIRLWAGKKDSKAAEDKYVARIISESRRIADMAAEAGIVVAYEFHSGTLTDTNASARRLLEAVRHKNVKTYWQPASASVENCLDGISEIMPWLAHIHAFYWDWNCGKTRALLLAEGAEIWKRYLEKIRASGRDHFVMIEFVKDGSVENFMLDAATLKACLENS